MGSPSLAIALAVKRRAGKKKMAKGGHVEEGPSPKDQEHRAGTEIQQEMRPRYARGGEVRNQMLNPENRNDFGVKNQVLKQFGLDKHDQSHGQLKQPHQIESDFDPKSESAQKYRKYAPKGPYSQTYASDASQDEAYLAKGGYPGEADMIRTESPIHGHDLGDDPESYIDHDMDEPDTDKMIHTGYSDYDTRLAEGGQIGDKDKMASAQASMRKAFKFNAGGAIASAVMKKRQMAQGGYLQPEYAYLEENDSYPDVDQKEHDVLDYDVDDPRNKVAKRKTMIKKIFSED